MLSCARDLFSSAGYYDGPWSCEGILVDFDSKLGRKEWELLERLWSRHCVWNWPKLLDLEVFVVYLCFVIVMLSVNRAIVNDSRLNATAPPPRLMMECTEFSKTVQDLYCLSLFQPYQYLPVACSFSLGLGLNEVLRT